MLILFYLIYLSLVLASEGRVGRFVVVALIERVAVGTDVSVLLGTLDELSGAEGGGHADGNGRNNAHNDDTGNGRATDSSRKVSGLHAADARSLGDGDVEVWVVAVLLDAGAADVEERRGKEDDLAGAGRLIALVRVAVIEDRSVQVAAGVRVLGALTSDV